MRFFTLFLRLVLGVFLLRTAAMKFGFLGPLEPALFTPEGFIYLEALRGSGFIWPAVGIVSFFCGTCLLLNRFVGLAAVVLMPISLNFLLFHLFYDPSFPHAFGLQSYFLFLANIYFLWRERKRYEAVLRSR